MGNPQLHVDTIQTGSYLSVLDYESEHEAI